MELCALAVDADRSVEDVIARLKVVHLRHVALGRADGAPVLAGRDVQHHEVQGPGLEQLRVRERLPARQAPRLYAKLQ